MSEINQVRARLERAVAELPGSRIAIDVGALLADHARLQAAHTNALAAMRQAVIALAHAQQGDPIYMQAYGVLDMAIEAAKDVQQ